MVKQVLLDQITELVCSLVDPKRIILFGSHSTVTVTEESDLDVLIVVDDRTDNLRDLRRQLHLKIAALASLPCDVLVEHESTFEQRSLLPTLERNIKETGRTFYAA